MSQSTPDGGEPTVKIVCPHCKHYICEITAEEVIVVKQKLRVRCFNRHCRQWFEARIIWEGEGK